MEIRQTLSLSEQALTKILAEWGKQHGLGGPVIVLFHYTPGDRPGEDGVVSASLSGTVVVKEEP